MMVIPEEELEDTKGVIKSSRSKKDRQYYCQKKKDKRTKYDKVLEPNTDGKFHQLLTSNSRCRCYPVLRVSHVEQELFTLPGYLSLLQYYCQKKKDKRTKYDLQNIT
jgi:hypothetical protein